MWNLYNAWASPLVKKRPLRLRSFLLIVILLSWEAPFSTVAAEPLTTRGAALAHACAACHGPDGRSQGLIPSIDTLPKNNFVDALQTFRSGARQGTVMSWIAKGLDDTDIEALAAYFAALQSP
jgi:cytochrome c553